MFEFKSFLPGWWLAVPILAVVLSVFFAVKWRRWLAGILAIISLAIATVTAVAWPLSMRTNYLAELAWEKPQPKGMLHHCDLVLHSNGGGIKPPAP